MVASSSATSQSIVSSIIVRRRRITGIACCRVANADAGASASRGGSAASAHQTTALDQRTTRRGRRPRDAGPLGSRLHAVRPIWPRACWLLHERQTALQHRSSIRSIAKLTSPLGPSPVNCGNRFHRPLRKTISFDNGTEFAEHHRLHRTTRRCKPSSAIPTSPWQKGGVENSIGRLQTLAASQNRPRIPSPSRQLSQASFSVSTIPHENAWTSRHPPRHSLNSNQSLHFKRESITPPSRA